MKIFIFLFFITLQNSFPQIITNDYINTLSEDKTWLLLLHHKNNEKKSSILNQEFFISKKGNVDSKKELFATLNAYNKKDINGTLYQCKFPARYTWLSDKLPKRIQFNIEKCPRLFQWSLEKDTSSISAMFVSGFLGNPASAFGHSFLKINKNTLEQNLFDTTISYGALLPPKYTMLSYMYNGLTGGYDASYSDKYYYMDEMVYSNQEFRDMWEYKLHMTKREKRLLFYHLWELKGIHFSYYFFNRNCGYKTAELLQLVSKGTILEGGKIWYAPAEMFYHLKDINKIENIIYHPSSQQKLYSFYHSLTKDEKIEIKNYFNSKERANFDKFPIDSKIKIYDFLLAFYVYALRNSDKTTEEYHTLVKERAIILRNRLHLPMLEYKKQEPLVKREITDNNMLSRLDISVGQYNHKHGIYLGYTPFTLDATGYNTKFGDILSILNSRFFLTKNRINLISLDLINIRRLKVEELPFDIDNPLSWSIQIGAKREKNTIDYYIDAGLGYTWLLGKHYKLYSMLNLSTHSTFQHWRVHPNIGLFADYNTFKADINYGKENSLNHTLTNDIWNISMQYSMQQNISPYVEYHKAVSTSLIFGIKWHF